MADKILEHDTWLYSSEAPSGRLFAAGDAVPGKGWQDSPEGLQAAPTTAPITSSTAGDVELREIERLEGVVAEKDRELESLKSQFDARWAEISQENEALRAQVAKFDADGDGKPGGSKAKA